MILGGGGGNQEKKIWRPFPKENLERLWRGNKSCKFIFEFSSAPPGSLAKWMHAPEHVTVGHLVKCPPQLTTWSSALKYHQTGQIRVSPHTNFQQIGTNDME